MKSANILWLVPITLSLLGHEPQSDQSVAFSYPSNDRDSGLSGYVQILAVLFPVCGRFLGSFDVFYFFSMGVFVKYNILNWIGLTLSFPRATEGAMSSAFLQTFPGAPLGRRAVLPRMCVEKLETNICIFKCFED